VRKRRVLLSAKNIRMGGTLAKLCPAVLTIMVPALAANAQTSILTQHYDNERTGQNTAETVLTPANVNSATFGKLFALGVDGFVWAQPLYVPGMVIPGQGTHNVLYVATEHDSVYAFDADTGGAPLWWVTFLVNGATTLSPADAPVWRFQNSPTHRLMRPPGRPVIPAESHPDIRPELGPEMHPELRP
jgi:hypothetical protein